MNTIDNKRLDELLNIAHEFNTPMTDKDVEFIESLDSRMRERGLSEKQEKWFDDLVKKHLQGE